MKILFCGGGSAGHISPALAIAEAIKKKNNDVEFLFVSREGGSESEAVINRGIKLETLKIKGLKRSLSTENIKRIGLAIKSINKAEKILKDFSPDAVVATGGYVSWPVAKAAKRLRIPLIFHESNSYPGLVTRMMSAKCDLVLLNYKECEMHLKKGTRTAVVGNPLLSDFFKYTKGEARKKLNLKNEEIFILSFGGSLGAEKINETVISLMESYSIKTNNLSHIHATGKKHFPSLGSEELKRGINGCKIIPYISNMPLMLKAADIVICRSGAMTLSELSAAGAAAILIPSDHVTNDHQHKNAKLLYDKEACLLIEEKSLSKDLLATKISYLINEPNERKKLSANIKKLSAKNASDKCANCILELINTNSSALH